MTAIPSQLEKLETNARLTRKHYEKLARAGKTEQTLPLEALLYECDTVQILCVEIKRLKKKLAQLETKLARGRKS